MKKILAIGTLVLALSLLALAVSAETSDSKGKEIAEERIMSRINPAPFENIKVPLSGISEQILRNPDMLKGLGKEEVAEKTSQPPITGTITGTLKADIRFNLETGTLHQNEETVVAFTHASKNIVVEGANDYRGFWGLLSGASGYYVSNDDGLTVLREGGIPKISGTESGTGQSYIGYSGGDPVIDINNTNHNVYYSSMFFNDTTNTWAVGIAKATPTNLVDTALPDDTVWSVVKQVRADDAYTQANDKPWMAVDNSGGKYGGYVYMTWTAFNAAGAKIWMARCTPTLSSCTTLNGSLNPVSGAQDATQMSMVNVDSAGRVVVTWVEYDWTNPNPPYYKVKLWYRIFGSGGATALTPPRLITTLDKPVSFYYAGLGNEFRIPANAWSEVAVVGGDPRLYVAYFDCKKGSYLYDIPSSYYADSCSNIDSYLRYVSNYQSGAPSTSGAIGLDTSSSYHAFWPTMSVNPSKNKLDIAFYRTESSYNHDLYVAQQQRNLTTPATITQATTATYAGDPDSETYFSTYGVFIGDYIQSYTKPGTTNTQYIGYNANTRYTGPISYTVPGYDTIVKFGGYQHDNRLRTETYS